MDRQEGLLTPPRPPGGSSNSTQTSAWASQPLPDHFVGLPGSPGPLGGPPDLYRTFEWNYRPCQDLRVGPQPLQDLREGLLDLREGLGSPPKGPVGFERPSIGSERGR